MSKEDTLKAIEDRAFALRKTLQEVCREAKVAQSTFSRWRKNPDMMKPTTLKKIEDALDRMECKTTA